MGRRTEALASAERGLKVSETLGDQGRITKYRLLLGQLLIDEGKLVEAERHLLEARVQAEQRGALREQALADEFLGDLMARRGRTDEADANYRTAEDRARQISEANDILAEVLRRRAALLLKTRPELAETLARRGLEVAQRCGEEFERPFLQRTLAAALREKGELAPACLELQSALSGFRAARLPGEMAVTLEALADVHEEMGGREHLLLARAQVQEALALDLDSAGISPCSLQLRLAHLELQLGNCDEALLALFELERLSCGSELDTVAEVEALRGEIERKMGSQARQVCDQVQKLAELPDLLVDDEFPASVGLTSVLQSIAERLGAERAFAVFVRAAQPELIAAWQCPTDTARKLASVAAAILRSEGVLRGPRVFSRTDEDPVWRQSELGTHAPHRTAVAFGIESESTIVGLVYLDSGSERGLAFDTESLAMASTYIHLVQGTLLDELRAREQRRRAIPAEPAFEHVLTSSEKVLDVLRLCSKVASSPYTVLLTGETGVGKGLLARTLHELSPRRERPMVSVNCAAIPETLLESELFGHIKGSFTGADRDRVGLIETAAGGTLFLDEVGKMSLPMQAKLLHFLDTKELRPVGGSATRRVDVRVICATRRDLRRMVSNDEFLEDLYYRLLDFPIEVPPLRERGEDVLLLARHYVEASALELGRETPRMTRNFAQRLADYAWPGNVRELEKVIKRAVILAADDDRLREQHLPAELVQGRRAVAGDDVASEVRPLRDQVAQLERQVLQHALERSAWNRSQVARELRISYPTLLQKIRLYDLNPLA
jgi:sigma-54-dependent transcriptional regulator